MHLKWKVNIKSPVKEWKSSGSNTPILFFGIGMPNRRARVGARST
jgi:hypothetical protein